MFRLPDSEDYAEAAAGFVSEISAAHIVAAGALTVCVNGLGALDTALRGPEPSPDEVDHAAFILAATCVAAQEAFIASNMIAGVTSLPRVFTLGSARVFRSDEFRAQVVALQPFALRVVWRMRADWQRGTAPALFVEALDKPRDVSLQRCLEIAAVVARTAEDYHSAIEAEQWGEAIPRDPGEN